MLQQSQIRLCNFRCFTFSFIHSVNKITYNAFLEHAQFHAFSFLEAITRFFTYKNLIKRSIGAEIQLNHLKSDSNKRPYMLKQTCSFQLQDYLNMQKPGIKGLNLRLSQKHFSLKTSRSSRPEVFCKQGNQKLFFEIS